MIKEFKYLIYLISIVIFLFFTIKYYFSDTYKKKSFRSYNNIKKNLILNSEKIPILFNDTQNIIIYVENTNTKKKKKFYFWELLKKDD